MDRPSSFQSFADYLGLNEQALKEMQDAAAERAEQANYDALGSLWQAESDARSQGRQSGDGSLSSQASYQDYLKKRREAEEMRRPTGPMSAREAALRGMRPVENRFTRDWKATEAQSRGAVEGQNRAYFAEQDRVAAERAAKEAAAAAFDKRRRDWAQQTSARLDDEERALIEGPSSKASPELRAQYNALMRKYGGSSSSAAREIARQRRQLGQQSTSSNPNYTGTVATWAKEKPVA